MARTSKNVIHIFKKITDERALCGIKIEKKWGLSIDSTLTSPAVFFKKSWCALNIQHRCQNCERAVKSKRFTYP